MMRSNDYDFTIYPLQEGGCVLFSRGRDEGDDRIADPVIVPFAALLTADRSGISLR